MMFKEKVLNSLKDVFKGLGIFKDTTNCKGILSEEETFNKIKNVYTVYEAPNKLKLYITIYNTDEKIDVAQQLLWAFQDFFSDDSSIKVLESTKVRRF